MNSIPHPLDGIAYNDTFFKSNKDVGEMKHFRATAIFAITISAVQLTFTTSAVAQDLFDKKLKGLWGAPCGDESTTWFIMGTGWRSPNLLCASSESKKTESGYSLFMECRGDVGNVTYMGDLTKLSKDQIHIELTEYRGATGAEDIVIDLTRCRE